ncbi:MAG: hypothetical protein GY930_03855 [bacterium]|nr:hypothetical protein [bacterium]
MPQSKATVHVVSGGRLVESMACDPAGIVQLQPIDGPGLLVAQAPNQPAVFLELDKLEGRHEMQVAHGASLSGVLIEDGHIPDRPIPLSLDYKPVPHDKLSEAVQTALNSAGVLIGKVRLQSNRLGRFEFRGLKPDWWGYMRLPSTHWFTRAPEGSRLGDGSPEIVELRSPVQNWRFQISRLPSIQGRVVDAQTGEAVANPFMVFHATFTDKDNSPSRGICGEDDGSFAVGFSPGLSDRSPRWLDPSQRPGIEKVTVQIGNNGQYLSASYSFDIYQVGSDGQLGDLAVRRGINLPLRILDSSGSPISGARASVSGSGSNTDPSDDFGLLTLSGISPETQELYVGAPYRRLRLFKLQKPANVIQDRVDVVLQRGSRLDINLSTTPITATRFLSLSLEGTDARLFEFGNPALGLRLNRATGSSALNSSSWGAQGGRGTLEPSADGIYSIRNLIPGMAIDLVVRDRSNNELLRKSIETPAWGETSTFALAIPQPCFDLTISAHDSRCAPVQEVVVTVRKGDSNHSTSATTTSDGHATLLEARPRRGPFGARPSKARWHPRS